MTYGTDPRPWERLSELLAEHMDEELQNYVEAMTADELLHAMFRLSREEQKLLLSTITPDSAAELIEDIPDAHAAGLIDALPVEDAASIVEEMDSDEQADLLGEMPTAEAEAILELMDEGDADEARRLIRYADDVAGGLMMTELISFPQDFTVRDAIEALSGREEDYAYYNVQYLYVVDEEKHLLGIVRLRDMVFRPPHTLLGDIAVPAVTARAQTGLDDLEELFDQRPLSALPVVDAQNRLLGVVRRDALMEAVAERAEADNLKVQGIVGGDELRSMPVLLRSRRRLSWLSVNIVLNVLAASVIALYQDTISAVIALAVFLPIVSDMSGCSGNQAVAVSLRELTLGVARPGDAMRVWTREVSVGLINGAALGTLIALVAWLWQGSPLLGLVIGAALAINTVVAVSIGGTVPLLLKSVHVDPALASGPMLTTITDMCGFFLVLSFATMALPHLAM